MCRKYIAYTFKRFAEVRSEAYPNREDAARELFGKYPAIDAVETCAAFPDATGGNWKPNGMNVKPINRIDLKVTEPHARRVGEFPCALGDMSMTEGVWIGCYYVLAEFKGGRYFIASYKSFDAAQSRASRVKTMYPGVTALIADKGGSMSINGMESHLCFATCEDEETPHHDDEAHYRAWEDY